MNFDDVLLIIVVGIITLGMLSAIVISIMGR